MHITDIGVVTKYLFNEVLDLKFSQRWDPG
jgi:hypothetical protein